MSDLAILELRVDLQEANRLYVTCRYDPADEKSESDRNEGPGGLFSESAFLALADDAAGYGRALATILFEHPKVAELCGRAFADAMKGAKAMRLRIAIAANAHVLHGIHWEKLLHPTGDVALARAGYIVFSRIITQSDWRSAGPRRRDSLRTLTCIADDVRGPDGAESPFQSFDGTAFSQASAGYLTRAEAASIGANHDATRSALGEHLARGVDVLYAVCHGYVDKAGEPALVLHDQDGRADFLKGPDISQLFRELRVVPRLAVLVSCGSAGASVANRSANAIHIAPRLAEAGVACVIGFNGRVNIELARKFCAALFAKLNENPDIEEAMREARRAMGDEYWWMPVLLTRMRSGTLWYEQGVSSASGNDARARSSFWPALIERVTDGTVTPIVGPDVTTSLLGPRRELALRWALKTGYPLVPGGNDSLPQIAQYMSTMNDRLSPISKAIRFAYKLLQRAGEADKAMRADKAPLRDLITDIGRLIEENLVEQWKDDQVLEPYRAIAKFQSNVFVTLDWSDRLYHALKKEGKEPIVIVPWYWMRGAPQELARRQRELRANAAAIPSTDKPILYYVFGRLSEDSRSLAMSEDDHFDTLIELARDAEQFPVAVRSALCENKLMFIGCNTQEWNFRVMLRLIVSCAGFSGASNNCRHVAANIGPDDPDFVDPGRVREYFEKYLTDAAIDLYSGTATDFLSELTERSVAQRDVA